MKSYEADQHQYYGETMEISQLSHIKIILNTLMEGAISANNTSGECLMLSYHTQLKLINEKQLCFHAILSKQNVTETILVDRNSNLSPASEKRIYDADKTNDKKLQPNY